MALFNRKRSTSTAPASTPAACTAAAKQFHTLNPTRYYQECEAVLSRCAALNPVLTEVPDGRRGFLVDIAIPDPEGKVRMPDGSHRKIYKILLLWSATHPESASQLYGGSITAYFASPTGEEVRQRMRDKTGHETPHLIMGTHPITGRSGCVYMCTAQHGDLDTSFTMVEAIANATNWLTLYGAALYSPDAYARMAAH